jgi:hypothetical protein
MLWCSRADRGVREADDENAAFFAVITKIFTNFV